MEAASVSLDDRAPAALHEKRRARGKKGVKA